LVTLAGKRGGFVNGGRNVYDKKPQCYAENNTAVFNRTQW